MNTSSHIWSDLFAYPLPIASRRLPPAFMPGGDERQQRCLIGYEVVSDVATCAVFAPLPCRVYRDLAVSCRDLAAFATLTCAANRANPLEMRDQSGGHLDTRPKNGKNGNVHRASQHYRPGLPPVRAGGRRGRQALQARIHSLAGWGNCPLASALAPLAPQGEEPGARNPTPPLDKTRPLMAEWRTHDESFMFARERRIHQFAAQRELTAGRSVFTMAGIETHACRITQPPPDPRRLCAPSFSSSAINTSPARPPSLRIVPHHQARATHPAIRCPSPASSRGAHGARRGSRHEEHALC